MRFKCTNVGNILELGLFMFNIYAVGCVHFRLLDTFPNAQVASKYDGKTQMADKDWPTYLCPPGVADIFFPSDFGLLSLAYTETCGRSCQTMTQRDFLLKYADIAATETRNGDNPMVDDYSNMSVLFTTPTSASGSQP